jgi:Protein of unknown function (DUF1353)
LNFSGAASLTLLLANAKLKLGKMPSRVPHYVAPPLSKMSGQMSNSQSCNQLKTPRREFLLSLLSVSALASTSHLTSAVGQTSSCKFSANPKVELLTEPTGRKIRLLEQFTFTDSNGRRWPVPPGAIADGASIPWQFWSIIGGPLDGPYRNPSIVHDYYCDSRTRKSLDVHAMFYSAMLCAEVGPKRAFIMYEAVKRFGPYWKDPMPLPAKCEDATDDYDFALCTQNASPPERLTPALTKKDLESFIQEFSSQADLGDLQKLQGVVNKL